LLGIDPRAARYTWTAAVVLLLIGLVYLISGTLLIFTTALLLAYLLYPLMDLIDRHIPSKTRTPALALTYLLLIGFLAAFIVFVGIQVAEQATSLAKSAPALLDEIQKPPPPGPASQVIAVVQDQIRKHYGEIASVVPKVTLGVLSASRNLIYLVIIPILSFFILRDGRDIRDSFLSMFDGERKIASEILADVHTLLLQYMRALLFLCCNTFIVFSIVFSAMQMPYALLLASVAFPLEFIPLVGPLAAAVIILVVTALSGYPHVIWLFAFLAVYRLIQDYLVSPKLMSRGVELHPLLVIFGVFAGGEAGGVAGVFLSIPTLALIRMLYHRLGKTRAARRTRSAA
jgi:predicted PurR-regulated permease PerM